MSKKKTQENYLDRIPKRNPIYNWTADGDGVVTLEVENKGVMNRIAQKLLKKPKISYVHLDEMGSFIWQIIDGERDITSLGEDVSEHFGDKAEPLYPRLAKYVQILNSYGFVVF